jgi:hypothetical protein
MATKTEQVEKQRPSARRSPNAKEGEMKTKTPTTRGGKKMAAKTLWRRPRRRYPHIDLYWVNRYGDLITEDNEKLTDPADSRLQIVQFLNANDLATEIILTPRDLSDLRDVLNVKE